MRDFLHVFVFFYIVYDLRDAPEMYIRFSTDTDSCYASVYYWCGIMCEAAG